MRGASNLARMTDAHDADTLAFYNREAGAYVANKKPARLLAAFIIQLPRGARVLELGAGSGHDAQAMIEAGLDVTATDGSSALAAHASERIGRPVRVMRFDELTDVNEYAGVWANASLLHARAAALPHILARIHAALTPSGIFHASYKAGEGEGRDSLGRYYNFPTRAALEAAYQQAGPWSRFTIEEAEGGGYDGVARTWLLVAAVK